MECLGPWFVGVGADRCPGGWGLPLWVLMLVRVREAREGGGEGELPCSSRASLTPRLKVGVIHYPPNVAAASFPPPLAQGPARRWTPASAESQHTYRQPLTADDTRWCPPRTR